VTIPSPRNPLQHLVIALADAHATAADGGPPAELDVALRLLDSAFSGCPREDLDDYDLANVHLARARLTRLQERDASSPARAALRHARKCGTGGDERRMLVHCLIAAAVAERDQGDYPTARRHLDEAVSIATTELGDSDDATAAAHNALGLWARYRGDTVLARRCYSAALAATDERQDPDAAAAVLHNLASVEHLAGDTTAALDHIDAALTRRRPGTPGHDADLGVRAVILTAMAEFDEARTIFTDLRHRILNRHGSESMELMHLDANRAVLEHSTGHLGTAADLYRSAITTARDRLGAEHPEVGVLEANLAQLALDVGDSESARDHARRASYIFKATATDHLPSAQVAIRILHALTQ
jgi:tetratricopeptide (TPR) repeat protein